MSQPSAKSFLKLLGMSGIVAEDQLKSELAVISKNADGRAVKTAELIDHLVDSGLITQWHTEKLLDGKYKGFFLGKFKLLGHLGSGGMSSVYLARHRISEQLRAIKVLPRKKVSDKSYLDRFYLEARAAASLNHPNVVRIYDICNEGNTHYMVMEYVEGNDLYNVVNEKGPLDFAEAARYTAEAAEGLSHAHERELVHRDIKPANLLRMPSGNIKILDLGLALVNQDDSQSLTVLYNEKVMGTADYLSPEQAVNSHKVDLRADIYSLGCTLYFFLTGHPPFFKGTLAQRIAMHQTQQAPKVTVDRPDCPQALVDICEKMMQKDPADRYQNCAELQTALNVLLDSGFEASPVKPGNSEKATPGRQRIDVGAIAAQENLAGGSREVKDPPFNIGVASAAGTDSGSVRVPPPPRRRLKTPPKWVMPVSIVMMFVVLFAVLTIVAMFFL